MNGTNLTASSKVIARIGVLGRAALVFSRIVKVNVEKESIGVKKIISLIPAILISALIIFLLIVTKSKTLPRFETHPIAYSYSIFVTLFVLSRLGASLLFRRSIAHVYKGYENTVYEPFITFVVPSLNDGDSIKRTVEKCYGVDYPREKIEVIAINDGSIDNTLEQLRSLEGKYENYTIVDWGQNRGKRHGMAEGFKRAKGEIVIQLDADSYIEGKNFKNLIKPFANPEIAAVCAHADPENADQNVITKMQSAYYFMSFRIMKAAESVFFAVFCCSGCSSAYRKSMTLPLVDDWLKEEFLGLRVTWGDDRALTSWLLKSGCKTIYTDEVQAYTIVPDTFKKLLKQQLRWKKSWIVNSIITGRFIWKKRPFVAFHYFFPLVLVSFLTPVMSLYALVWSPIVHGAAPLYYLTGMVLIISLVVTYYHALNKENKYWPYLYLWALLAICLLSYLILIAIFQVRDRSWGTRQTQLTPKNA